MNVGECQRGWKICIGAMLCLVALPAPPRADALGTAPGDIAAHIVGLWGDVEVRSTHHPGAAASPEGDTDTATWAPAEIGQPLYLTDSLRTGRGRVRIQFTNRDDSRNTGPSIFNLGEHSQVTLTEYEIFDGTPRGVIDLLGGYIESFIKGWGGQAGFSVRAGVAVVGIRGTTLTIKYTPEREEVVVEVSEGEVVLTGPGGSRVIKAGQRAIMVNGEFPGEGPT